MSGHFSCFIKSPSLMSRPATSPTDFVAEPIASARAAAALLPSSLNPLAASRKTALIRLPRSIIQTATWMISSLLASDLRLARGPLARKSFSLSTVSVTERMTSAASLICSATVSAAFLPPPPAPLPSAWAAPWL